MIMTSVSSDPPIPISHHRGKMQSYERLSSSFPGSLTFQKVRPARSSGTLVTSVKYSPVSKSGSDSMIAVADINGSLTVSLHTTHIIALIEKFSPIDSFKTVAGNYSAIRHCNEGRFRIQRDSSACMEPKTNERTLCWLCEWKHHCI